MRDGQGQHGRHMWTLNALCAAFAEVYLAQQYTRTASVPPAILLENKARVNDIACPPVQEGACKHRSFMSSVLALRLKRRSFLFRGPICSASASAITTLRIFLLTGG